MRIVTETVDLPRDGGVMRVHIARPAAEGRFPALAFYSDIFQLTESTLRTMARFAGYGFVVAAPEIYWRFEPPGTAIPFDDAGRDRGQADARRMRTQDFDADIVALVEAIEAWAFVEPDDIGAIGFCLGGHVALRAAFLPAVRATVCLYPTGLHNGDLAGDGDAGSLERARSIRGSLRVVYGTLDPHTDAAARERVSAALGGAGIELELAAVEAEHAFMRDVGPRYDPKATDQQVRAAVAFYRRAFGERI